MHNIQKAVCNTFSFIYQQEGRRKSKKNTVFFVVGPLRGGLNTKKKIIFFCKKIPEPLEAQEK